MYVGLVVGLSRLGAHDDARRSERCRAPLQLAPSVHPAPSIHLALSVHTHMEELEIGQAVELMGVENAGLDITGTRGTVKSIQHGLVSVTIDGSDEVVSAWPENLKILRGTQAAAASNSATTKTEPG